MSKIKVQVWQWTLIFFVFLGKVLEEINSINLFAYNCKKMKQKS